MDILPTSLPAALCGEFNETDKLFLLQALENRKIRVVPWASNIGGLIIGSGAETKWKYRQAHARGIRILSIEDCLAAACAENELWTVKYSPSKITDIIGNGGPIADLMLWLRKWGAGPRAALISGPPGIGKTTSVHLIVRECGYEVVEFNASNERSATAVKKLFETAAGSAAVGKRRVIVMDEVDGMSSGDRGGIGELARVIKTASFPIICIANERSSPRIRPLVNCTLDIRFSRPTKTMISKALMAGIVKQEKLPFSASTLETLCERNGNDIRSILNFLQFSGISSARGDAKDELQRVDAFSATGRLFGGGGSLDARANLVYIDHGLIPLMVGEAYIAAAGRPRDRCDTGPQLERCGAAADLIGNYDILDRRIRSSQNWGLFPAAVNCIVGAAAATGGPAPFQIFPSWLGKNSKRLKHRRWYMDMARRAGLDSGMLLESRDLLRARLFHGSDAAAVVDTLESLGLSRDDMMETLTETVFSGDEEAVKFDAKLKAAVSREWKKRTAAATAATAADDTNAQAEAEDYISDGDSEFDPEDGL